MKYGEGLKLPHDSSNKEIYIIQRNSWDRFKSAFALQLKKKLLGHI